MTSLSEEHLVGRVKWFNNKAGFGFITYGKTEPQDIFVHHSSIMVNSEQFKYLVIGEYVDFTLTKTEKGEHEYQATNVKGIDGGKLMCETRKESRTLYLEKKDSNNTFTEVVKSKKQAKKRTV